MVLRDEQTVHRGFLWKQNRNWLPMQETWDSGLFPGKDDPLEKELATHCSIFAWKIPWTEEPGGLQSMRLQRVRHDGACVCARAHTHTESYSVLYYNCGNMTYFVQSYRIYNNVYIHSMDCTVHGLLTGQYTGVSSCSLLQRIFHTQESNWSLLHWRRILYQMCYMGSP